MFNGISTGFGITGEELLQMAVAPIEKLGVIDEAIFHHLGKAGSKLATWKGFKNIGIDSFDTRSEKRLRDLLPWLGI